MDGELLISLTGSQMKFTGPIMVRVVISGFTLLHAEDSGVFSSCIPHGSVIASSGGLIRHFLVTKEYKPQGPVSV